MKKVLIHIFLLIIAGLFTYAQNDCLVPVTINSNIDSSLIFIDGNLVGSGNVEVDLEINSHEIVLMSSTNKWGSEIIRDSIQVTSCDDSLLLSYNFEQMTTILSNPDAAVVANNLVIGYTPLSLSMNYKNVTLQKTGYDSRSILLQNVTVQPNVQLKFTGDVKQEPFIKSTLFKILVGSAVALGATAAYFKLEADKNFDKYLETRNNSYLDDTDAFDLYSGIAFGALQLNFGALLYYFLSE